MKPTHFRWHIILLLFLINIVNYIDRSSISFAVPLIKEEFALSTSQIGLVLGAFGIGYVLTTLLGGLVADKIGARITYAVAVLVWSFAIGWTGAAVGFVTLYCARIVLGLAEGPTFPAHARVVERWLPPNERATAIAAALVAIPIALAVGAPAVSYLIDAVGWRVMFFILAGLGVLWLPIWLYFCRDFPSQSRFTNEAERSLIGGDNRAGSAASNQVAEKSNWRVLLTTPTLLAGYWAYFVFGYLLFFLMTWLPEFLRTTYDLDITQIGWLAAIPWAASALTLYAVGRWSDRLIDKSGSLRIARSYFIAGSQLIVAVAIIPLAFVHDLTVVIVCLSVAVSAALGANPVFYAVIADIVPRQAGTCMGITNTGLAIAGFVAPVVTGFVLQETGGFSAAFWLISLLAASSVIAVLIWHRPDKDAAR
ncbi:MAG: MFS transporter [Pseudomonadota bacterium]